VSGLISLIQRDAAMSVLTFPDVTRQSDDVGFSDEDLARHVLRLSVVGELPDRNVVERVRHSLDEVRLQIEKGGGVNFGLRCMVARVIFIRLISESTLKQVPVGAMRYWTRSLLFTTLCRWQPKPKR
jgi:hypothetical protein